MLPSIRTLRTLSLLCAGLLAGLSVAHARGAARDVPAAYAAKTHESPKGGTLPYRQLDPKSVTAGARYPLVVFLHGAGGRGSDNRRQLTDGGMLSALETIGFRDNHPCFFIAPQVPSGKRWVEVSWSLSAHTMPVRPGAQMRMLLELIDAFVKNHPVDTSRIYVTGFSMGGFGTWDAIQRRPDLFAAAAPVCGGGDVALAPKLTGIPLWVWHGGKDNVVKTKRSRDMVAAIKKAGGKPAYTELPETGHNAWTPAYTNRKLWDWLFRQRRGGGPARAFQVAVGEKIRVACVGDSITFGAGIRDRRRNSYPAQMGGMLGAGWDVRNFGHNGRTMLKKGDHPLWKERAYRDAIAFQPHAVVIKLGTNDTKPRNWRYKAEFAGDTIAMVKQFQALDSKPLVFLCKPVPAFPEKWGIRDSVIRQEVLPLIDKAAAATGAGVIDLYKALKGRKDLFPDRIHPNVAGAKILAETVAVVLRKHQPAANR